MASKKSQVLAVPPQLLMLLHKILLSHRLTTILQAQIRSLMLKVPMPDLEL
jgi:hypothetical protein